VLGHIEILAVLGVARDVGACPLDVSDEAAPPVDLLGCEERVTQAGQVGGGYSAFHWAEHDVLLEPLGVEDTTSIVVETFDRDEAAPRNSVLVVDNIDRLATKEALVKLPSAGGEELTSISELLVHDVSCMAMKI
jgi:hypothetical protein